MIAEVVTFKLPTGMTRDKLIENYRQTAPKWCANPDLLRKNYLLDEDNGHGGGVYLWKTIEDAKKWHGEEFRKRVKELYGSDPEIRYFETPIVVDNVAEEIGSPLDADSVGLRVRGDVGNATRPVAPQPHR